MMDDRTTPPSIRRYTVGMGLPVAHGEFGPQSGRHATIVVHAVVLGLLAGSCLLEPRARLGGNDTEQRVGADSGIATPQVGSDSAQSSATAQGAGNTQVNVTVPEMTAWGALTVILVALGVLAKRYRAASEQRRRQRDQYGEIIDRLVQTIESRRGEATEKVVDDLREFGDDLERLLHERVKRVTA